MDASGDEPHYLVMAQSLWREHDLDLRDNYAREDWREFRGGPTEPHYAAPRRDGRPFPGHSPGLPFPARPGLCPGRPSGLRRSSRRDGGRSGSDRVLDRRRRRPVRGRRAAGRPSRRRSAARRFRPPHLHRGGRGPRTLRRVRSSAIRLGGVVVRLRRGSGLRPAFSPSPDGPRRHRHRLRRFRYSATGPRSACSRS